jgi:hypothetical protein
VLDRIIKESYLIAVANPNSPNIHSTITEKLQKYTALKKRLVRIWQLKTASVVKLILTTMGFVPKKSHESLKLLNLHPALYILMQKAAIINACSIATKFLAEQ